MEIYKPNIGGLFWVEMALLFAAIIAIAVLVMMKLTQAGVFIPVLLIILVLMLVSLLVLARTSYTIDDENIIIQGAFGKREKPLGSVTKIIDTNKGGVSILSAEKIILLFGEEEKVSISPREKAAALEVLKECCPDAIFEEDRKEKEAKDEAAIPAVVNDGADAEADDAYIEDLSGKRYEEPAESAPTEWDDKPADEDPCGEEDASSEETGESGDFSSDEEAIESDDFSEDDDSVVIKSFEEE